MRDIAQYIVEIVEKHLVGSLMSLVVLSISLNLGIHFVYNKYIKNKIIQKQKVDNQENVANITAGVIEKLTVVTSSENEFLTQLVKEKTSLESEQANIKLNEKTKSFKNKLNDFNVSVDMDWWGKKDHLLPEPGLVKTGFHDIDKIITGFEPSQLVVVAGHSSVGKTTFMLDVVRNVAVKDKIPVAFITYENSSKGVVDRMLAAESTVDAYRIKSGMIYNDDEFNMIAESLNKLSRAPIFIDDETGCDDLIELEEKIRAFQEKFRFGLVVIDYIQLLNFTGFNKDKKYTELMIFFKNLSRQLKIPIVLVSQLGADAIKRGGEVRLSDLNEYESVARDADVVILLDDLDMYNYDSEISNIIRVLIEKNRNGHTGSVELYFDKHKPSFLSIVKKV